VNSVAQTQAVAAASRAEEFLPLAVSALRQVLQQRLPAETQLLLTPTPPDSRWTLESCATQPQALINSAQLEQAKQIVRLTCPAPTLWSANFAIQVSVDIPALRVDQTLAPGARLETAALTATRIRVAGLGSHYPNSVAAIRERRAKRPIIAGSILQFGMLEVDLAVRRGQHVQLLAASGGIVVRSSGVALQDARLGERVRVQNASSLKIVEGWAETGSQVRLQP
jgi:flagella basal body P-ring formation protein FlgA